jgi:hypothetical protein
LTSVAAPVIPLLGQDGYGCPGYPFVSNLESIIYLFGMQKYLFWLTHESVFTGFNHALGQAEHIKRHRRPDTTSRMRPAKSRRVVVFWDGASQ